MTMFASTGCNWLLSVERCSPKALQRTVLHKLTSSTHSIITVAFQHFTEAPVQQQQSTGKACIRTMHDFCSALSETLQFFSPRKEDYTRIHLRQCIPIIH
eukprot:TRINITY_DN44850_c1_g1_i8.p1 TRINITY_DN44850_c1_g1~~TRINITY_DN44850_c1_g1_i8.p1  ORF type:complete len:100 (-),score=15.97 TRINITY_DN44850_c1_g1_i8:184-483(-)